MENKVLRFISYVFVMVLTGLSVICAETVKTEAKSQGVSIAGYKKALVGIKKSISLAAYRNPDTIYKSGFICDKKKGLVVSVLSVAEACATVATYELTFSGGQKVEAKCLYKDPLIDIEILSFDPEKVLGSIGEISVMSTRVNLDAEVLIFSKNGEQEVVQKATVSSLYETVRPLTQQVFRVSLNTPGTSLGGVGVLKDGTCAGIVLEYSQTFARLLCVDYLSDILEALKMSQKPKRMFLKDAYVASASLADAARYSAFPEAVLSDFLKRYPDALAQGLMVTDVTSGSVFEPGDVLWALEGEQIGPSLCRLQGLLNKKSDKKKVAIKVYRQGTEKTLMAPLEDAWHYVIDKMVLFGGALFYESDLQEYRVYNIPLKSLMVSKVLPGSVFDSVFPAFPINGPPISYAQIRGMAGLPLISLSDLLSKMPQIAVNSHFSVLFKDFGCGVRGDNMLTTNRGLQENYVDFLASTSIPELLTWSDVKHSWDRSPIALPEQKCLIQ
jgi:hypothetical protein